MQITTDPKFNVLCKKREELIENRRKLAIDVTVLVGHERKIVEGKLIDINVQLNAVNIEWNKYREYYRYQIIWECAKEYIPASEREAFFRKVDMYIEMAENGEFILR